VTEFFGQDLTGARFENVDLRGARFHNVDLQGAVLRGLWLKDVEIDGYVEDLRINGVDVGPLVEAELDRRDPDRVAVRPTDADGFRAGWAVIERRWPETVDRARALPEELLHERVDGEWSFIETLRHLVFATDAWVLRAVLGLARPYHRLGLPHTDMGDVPDVPHDPGARPGLDEVLALRAERMAVVRRVIDQLTDEDLDRMTEPVPEAGYPASESFAVRRCLGAILTEEWEHRTFAERDLAVLEEGSRPPAGRP
jgi:hypothetical protein